MSKIYTFMAKRAGSRNWYFKRDYPVDVAKKAGEQFWRSLRSPDQRKAAERYADRHQTAPKIYDNGCQKIEGGHASMENIFT